MELKDDLFNLASEIIRKNRYINKTINCNIAIENGSVITEKDFLYNFPETPLYFVKQGIFEIISTDRFFRDRDVLKGEKDRQLTDFMFFWGTGTKNVRGLMAVTVDIPKLNKWFSSELENRLVTIPVALVKLPDGWKWYDKKSGIYQFGKRGVYNQLGKVRKKVFNEIMNLFEKFPSGISIQTLSNNTNISAERLRIEIDAINDNKKFKLLGLELSGDGSGIYKFFSKD